MIYPKVCERMHHLRTSVLLAIRSWRIGSGIITISYSTDWPPWNSFSQEFRNVQRQNHGGHWLSQPRHAATISIQSNRKLGTPRATSMAQRSTCDLYNPWLMTQTLTSITMPGPQNQDVLVPLVLFLYVTGCRQREGADIAL